MSSNIRARWAVICIAVVCLLWAGMIMGIVLEAALRPGVPSITRPISMDVGRVVFSALSKVEIVWCLLSAGLFFLARPFSRVPRLLGALLLLCWLIVALQTVFLLPLLVERAQLIIAGQPLPASPVHGLYSSSSLIKLGALITCAVLSMQALGGRPAPLSHE